MSFHKKIIIIINADSDDARATSDIISSSLTAEASFLKPPLLPWNKNETKLKLRLKQINSSLNSYVIEGGNTWINYVDDVINELGENVYFVCLKSDKDIFCKNAESKTKNFNFWNSKDQSSYKHIINDPLYPKYDTTKNTAIELYWEEYYSLAAQLAQRFPKNFKIFNNKEISQSSYDFDEISNFLGTAIPESSHEPVNNEVPSIQKKSITQKAISFLNRARRAYATRARRLKSKFMKLPNFKIEHELTKVLTIIPYKNRPLAPLRKTLDSLKKQKLNNKIQLQIVIADGGSDTKIYDELNKLCEQHNVTLVQKNTKNWNKSMLINTGASTQSSDFIFISDSDIFYSDQFINNLVSNAKGPNNYFVLTEVRELPESEFALNSTQEELFNKSWYRAEERGAWNFAEAFHYGWGLLFCSRKAFEHVNGYDEGFIEWGHEDLDMINRLKAVGVQLKVIENSNSHFCIHMSHAINKKESFSNKNKNRMIYSSRIKAYRK